MELPQLLSSAAVILLALIILVKLVGFRAFGKIFTISMLTLTVYLASQSTAPKKNLLRYANSCKSYQGARYYALHIASKRRVFIYTKGQNSGLTTEACILGDNGKNLAFNWYSMIRRNNINLDNPNAIDDIYNAKSKVVVNGSYGDYHIFSLTILPLFHVSCRAYKDKEGVMSLKTGYNDDRRIFIGQF